MWSIGCFRFSCRDREISGRGSENLRDAHRKPPFNRADNPIERLKKEAALQPIQIGQLLVQQGVLTEKQVEHIVRVQKASHRPFGDLAERLFGIDPQAVEDAWVQQYIRLAGTIDLNEQELDEQCLRLLSRRQAWQFHLLPMNRSDDHLNAATAPETLVRAVNFSARRLDEPVYFRIAQRQQLREFLMKHYPVPDFVAQFSEKL
jgi:hypothetical protein